MALLARAGASLHHEEHGAGFPLFLLVPGGMRSTIDAWGNAAINPLASHAGDLRLIAMDRRNAGQSSGPLEVADPWGAYADDRPGLLDSLGIDAYHPTETGREIAALAPSAELVEPWKDTPADVAASREVVRRFLLAHADRAGASL